MGKRASSKKNSSAANFHFFCATNHNQNDLVFLLKNKAPFVLVVSPLRVFFCSTQVCCKTGGNEWNLDCLIPGKATLGQLIDFPPFPNPPHGFSLSRLPSLAPK